MKHYIIVYSPKNTIHRFAWHSNLNNDEDKEKIKFIKGYITDLESKYGKLGLAYHMLKTDNETQSSIRAKSTFFRDVFFLSDIDFISLISSDFLNVSKNINKKISPIKIIIENNATFDINNCITHTYNKNIRDINNKQSKYINFKSNDLILI